MRRLANALLVGYSPAPVGNIALAQLPTATICTRHRYDTGRVVCGAHLPRLRVVAVLSFGEQVGYAETELVGQG